MQMMNASLVAPQTNIHETMSRNKVFKMVVGESFHNAKKC